MAESRPQLDELAGFDVIEVRVRALAQLFNAMDASPFRDQDLDPAAEEFIVGWAREVPHSARLALLVDLDRAPPAPGLGDEPAALRVAMRAFFGHRASAARSRMRQLLGVGRVSLLVGLVFLVAAIGAGDLISTAMTGRELGELLRQGLSIVGWVAMWRPIEIFLYGWWPIRTEARLYDRLSAMPVHITYQEMDDAVAQDAWRRDWPSAPATRPSSPRPTSKQPAPAALTPLDPMRERGPVEGVIAPGASKRPE